MTRRPISVARMLSERARSEAPQQGAAESVSGLFEGLQKLVEGLQDAARQADAMPEGEKKLVFGYQLKVGPMGTSAQRFGDRPEAVQEPATAAAREPIVDVFEEASEIIVVAELPGVDESTIVLSIEQDALLVETPAPHAYRKRIPLPQAVDAAGLSRSCRNGILEVRLPRTEPGA
jgi:HSP20 family protein